jgi:hypothetical protein
MPRTNYVALVPFDANKTSVLTSFHGLSVAKVAGRVSLRLGWPVLKQRGEGFFGRAVGSTDIHSGLSFEPKANPFLKRTSAQLGFRPRAVVGLMKLEYDCWRQCPPEPRTFGRC